MTERLYSYALSANTGNVISYYEKDVFIPYAKIVHDYVRGTVKFYVGEILKGEFTYQQLKDRQDLKAPGEIKRKI